MFMYTHMGYSECVAVRRPLASGDSLLPLCGSWGLNPSRQTWKQASLPAEPSHWPTLLSVSHVSWLLGSFAKKRLQMKTWRASCWFPAHSILPTRSPQPCGHPFPFIAVFSNLFTIPEERTSPRPSGRLDRLHGLPHHWIRILGTSEQSLARHLGSVNIKQLLLNPLLFSNPNVSSAALSWSPAPPIHEAPL